MVVVREFMDVTWSYITDSLQYAKSLKIFKDFVDQGQGLVNWSSRILEDYNTAYICIAPHHEKLTSEAPRYGSQFLYCKHNIPAFIS